MGTKLDLTNQYRTTWEEFVRATNALQDFLTAAAPDQARVEAALLDAEKARFAYNAARDLVAAQMAGPRTVASAPPQALPQDGKVRAVARLFWEVAGKPDGTDLTDWLRAERLVQTASSAG